MFPLDNALRSSIIVITYPQHLLHLGKELIRMRSKSEAVMQQIIEYVNRRYFNGDTVPSLQEIADVVHLNKSTISRYLTEMEAKGLISKSGAYYGLKTNSMKKVTNNLHQLPIVGDVACGTPILAEQNIESCLDLKKVQICAKAI